MKKIFLLLTAIFLFTSCEEDIVTDRDQFLKGGYARFSGDVVETANLDNGNGSVVINIEDANANAVQYRIYGVSSNIQGVAYPRINTNFIYSLPNKITLKLSDLAVLFGLTKDDLYYGDTFTFFGEVTTNDGRVFRGESPLTNGTIPTTNLTSVDLLNTTFGYKQAMMFTVTIACPSYIQSQMLGTYSSTVDPFGLIPPGHTFQCVNGNSPNTLKFLNWTNEGKDLIVTINSSAQSATVATQQAWFSAQYGWASVTGTGLVFSCIGTLNLKLTHTVAAGSFGSFPITLQKQ